MRSSCTRRQLTALVFVFSLAPVMRLVPQSCIPLAGSAAWTAPLIAIPFAILYIVYMSAFLRHRRENEGLAEMLMRSVGDTAGRVVLSLAGAFFVFYCGFILRSGAERFVSTVYPASSPWIFVFVMLLCGLIAASGTDTAVLRTAKLIAPILAAVLAAVTLFGLSSVEPENLLPAPELSAPNILSGAVPVLDVFAGVYAFAAFFEGGCPERSGRTREFALRLIPECLLISAILAAVAGSYGAAPASELTHPFFTMVRDITLFGSIERLEALVVALWVFPDFIVTAVTLMLARYCLSLALGYRPDGVSDKKNGRWLIPTCAAVSGIIACILPTEAEKAEAFSHIYVPAANLILTAGVYPLCFVIGKLRHKL